MSFARALFPNEWGPGESFEGRRRVLVGHEAKRAVLNQEDVQIVLPSMTDQALVLMPHSFQV